MKNNFTKETRELFDQGGYANCVECGRNHADCLHHILGRISNSPYNAAPLNNFECHMPEGRKGRLPINSEKQITIYLRKTKILLDLSGYEPTEEDLKFLKTYAKYY